ncbi:MAG: hypothetical protein M1353_09755 [Nitrospirae bacterium]|nr:hypothetical protein [Nitrospirota bacterium]
MSDDIFFWWYVHWIDRGGYQGLDPLENKIAVVDASSKKKNVRAGLNPRYDPPRLSGPY